jgi:hypothetical protein
MGAQADTGSQIGHERCPSRLPHEDVVGEGTLCGGSCFDKARAKGNRASEGFVAGGEGGRSPAVFDCAESGLAGN